MQHPVLDDGSVAETQRIRVERLFAELQLVRRRLEQTVLNLERHRNDPAAPREWKRVHQSAQTAHRALEAALANVPGFPFEEALIAPREFGADDITISIPERRAWYVDTPLDLTATELALLVALARAPERVFTKQELLRDVWGYRSPGRTRTIDSYASRLRRKLTAAGAPEGRYVVSLWGVGYSLIRP